MKAVATYRRYPDGKEFTVEYDTDDPCHFCGLPVVAASVGGTACCPWCDGGTCRFDAAHRVDMEPDGPRGHYQRYHADQIGAPAAEPSCADGEPLGGA